MSSELFLFDNTFFADPFSPSFIDDDNNTSTSIFQETTTPIDQIASTYLSSSPPISHQLENLSLCQIANPNNSLVGLDDFVDYSIKAEEFQLHFGASNNLMVPQSCVQNDVKLMQRSFSSNSFDNNNNNNNNNNLSFSIFTPQFDSLIESPNYQTSATLSSPENSFSSGQMRRVCSTGDLQKMKTSPLSSSPLSGERTFIEEAANIIKVGRYSAEERKERIHRYRAKRTQRNFNKTIKYACRKTLADNRPRIRGRFARNDEAGGEIPKTSSRFEDDDEFWIEGVHEEEEDHQGSSIGRRQFYHNFGSMIQYHQQYSSH